MQGTDDGAAVRCAPRQRPAEIQTYNRDPAVVAEYIARRTAQPLNGMLHRQQVRLLNQVLGAPSTWMLLAEVAP
ncbi:MAG TPA: hypothetical protein VL049_27850 [Candidatus Dormibacteraeota bacterium]|nr:hypothetical protein [Candidatus Dormibacteraeota bacterium]